MLQTVRLSSAFIRIINLLGVLGYKEGFPLAPPLLNIIAILLGYDSRQLSEVTPQLQGQSCHLVMLLVKTFTPTTKTLVHGNKL